MTKFRPIVPSSTKLAPNLAARVRQLRELRNMTVLDVSNASRFTESRLEDIESGVETWLSTTDRQLLAKALGITPGILKEAETRTLPKREPDALARELVLRRISESILNGSRDLECPDCRHILNCSVREGKDIEGYPIFFARAFCTKCPFVLSQ